MTYRRKLIEVALPLEEINKASAKEKAIRHGHPSTLHLWWARRPLATCRAVIFASLVDDPDDPLAPAAYVEACRNLPPGSYTAVEDTPRQRLFDFICKLVLWENSNNEQILSTARELIMLATDGNPPPLLDPFCGGGSIPLEAQRLGLKAQGSDLNPVAVLITKALIEIPPKFAGRAPVSLSSEWQPSASAKPRGKGRAGALKLAGEWRGATGLGEDVRFYGQWMRELAEARIGSFYPKAKLPEEQGGGEATVIAWLWARTVTCPNPVCGCRMPLVRSFVLSKKKGRETWAQPIVEPGSPPSIRFEMRSGEGEVPEGTMGGRRWRCLACGTTGSLDHVKAEGMAGRLSSQLMAIVAESKGGRIYLQADDEHIQMAESAVAPWKPDALISADRRSMFTPLYGLTTFGDLFTSRQLLALTTFSDLVGEAREMVERDALRAGMESDPTGLADGGSGARAYADAVATYLAFGVSRMSDICNALCRWESSKTQVRNLFGRQAIPMVWDFAEPNVFARAAGDFGVSLESLTKVIVTLPASIQGYANQQDATITANANSHVFSTDPPYYDNIGYADLSDFFYIWLRRSLLAIHPDLLSTLLVPKEPELVATPYRFGGDKDKAKEFFEKGLGESMKAVCTTQFPEYPTSVYYAYKQQESKQSDDSNDSSEASTGWSTFLTGMIEAGFEITATWPMRSELSNRMIATGGGGTNALASSIVLACRPRPADARNATKQEFLRELRRELPSAVKDMQKGNIAPVDLQQAAIGPGMGIFSRYSSVQSAEGGKMSVREALQAINSELDSILREGTEELDSATQWAVTWFESFGHEIKESGVAEQLALSFNLTLGHLQESGIMEAKGGKARLLKREEYVMAGWEPRRDINLNTWELMQRLVASVEQYGSREVKNKAEGLPPYSIMQALPAESDKARELAYRMFHFCTRKGLSREARAYNTLVQEWTDLLAQREREYGGGQGQQGDLGFKD